MTPPTRRDRRERHADLPDLPDLPMEQLGALFDLTWRPIVSFSAPHNRKDGRQHDITINFTFSRGGPFALEVVSEALTNTARHAGAAAAQVEVTAGEGVLRVSVHDDGRGGAAFGLGSGLLGLKDRVEALGGRMTLHSPPGAGNTLEVRVPLGEVLLVAVERT
jgi:Histidine kinase-, DNA gyrase B-, and HSP90-like ATPase